MSLDFSLGMLVGILLGLLLALAIATKAMWRIGFGLDIEVTCSECLRAYTEVTE